MKFQNMRKIKIPVQGNPGFYSCHQTGHAGLSGVSCDSSRIKEHTSETQSKHQAYRQQDVALCLKQSLYHGRINDETQSKRIPTRRRQHMTSHPSHAGSIGSGILYPHNHGDACSVRNPLQSALYSKSQNGSGTLQSRAGPRGYSTVSRSVNRHQLGRKVRESHQSIHSWSKS